MDENYEISEIINKIQNGTLTELKHFMKRKSIPINRRMYEAAFASENFNKIKILWENDSREKDIIINEIYNFLMIGSKKWSDIAFNFYTELVNYFISNNNISYKLNEIHEKSNQVNNQQFNETSINEKSLFMDNLLRRAIRRRINVLVEYLVNNGANINKKSLEEEVPIIYASKYSNENIINILINKGADVNEEDSNGNTPLSYVVKRKRINKKENII